MRATDPTDTPLDTLRHAFAALLADPCPLVIPADELPFLIRARDLPLPEAKTLLLAPATASEDKRTVWAATGKSWYKTEEGRITNNWSGSTIRYWWETRHADLSLYHQKARARASERIARPLETAAHHAAD